MRSILSWLIIISVLLGCRSAVSTIDNQNINPEELRDQMMFVVFQIQSQKPGKNKIVMVNKTITQGRLKSDFSTGNTSSYLHITIWNGDEVLYSSRMDHPLLKDAEYTKPNGEYSRKTIDLDEAEFFIRCKYYTNAESVVVEEVVNGNKIQAVEFKIKQ
jgi:hypothetical protein